MKILTQTVFTQPNLPTVALPAIYKPSPLAYFGASLSLWFRPDVGVTFDANGNVLQWNDQASHGKILLPTGPGTVAPKGAFPYSGPGSGIGGSNAGIIMGGASGQFFQMTVSDFDQIAYYLTYAFTLAFTFKYNSTATFGEIFSFAHQTSTPNVGWFVTTFNQLLGLVFVSPSSSNFLFVTGTQLVKGQAYAVVIQHDGTFTGAGVTMTVNGVKIALTATEDTLGSSEGSTPITSSPGQQFQLGGGILQGQSGGTSATQASSDVVGEFLTINRAISAAEVAFVSGYLNGRFAIY